MNKLSAYPRKTPATPSGDVFKAMNVVVTDSEDADVTQNPGGTWVQVADHRAIDLTYIYSVTADDYLEFKFLGTGLWLRYFGLPDGGKADVSVDGGTAKEFDTYSEAEGALMAFVASNLSPNTEHTVKIMVKGTKRIESNGFKVAIDSLIIELSRGSMQIWSMIEESLITKTTLLPQPIQVRPILGTSPILASPTAIVIFQDDFENSPLKWTASGSTITRDTSKPFSGGACGKLLSNSTKGLTSDMYRYFSRQLNEKMGLELWFYCEDADAQYVAFSLHLWDGTTWYAGNVRYTFSTQIWTYEDSSGVHQNIHSAAKPLWRTDYIHLKLIIDFENLKYGWLIVGRDKFDLRDYNLYPISNTSNPRIGVNLELATDTAGVKVAMLIDDVLVTNYEVI